MAAKVTEISNKDSLASQMRGRLITKQEKKGGAGVKIHDYDPENPPAQVERWIPLGKSFETASGGKGFPCGHITQLIGKKDSGKSTLMMKGMVECQKLGGVVYLLEPEHKFDFKRFELMGGNPADLEYVEVDSLEDAWNFMRDVATTTLELQEEGENPIIMLAWDSVATTVPNKILDEDDSGNFHVAIEAKINNKNVRKLRQLIKKTNIACVFINHYYMSQPKSKYEQAEVIIKGGEELGFLSTLIILMKRGAKLTRKFTKEINGKKKERLQQIGRSAKIEIVKGHFHGRTIIEEVAIVDKGILETDEELAEYRKSLKGKL